MSGGLTEVGPAVTLTSYGEVVEVSAILGTGNRGGVDMVWGGDTAIGHLGLDLTGPNGGVVRIDDLIVEDVTEAFLRSMLGWVDVRDYGAIGDGVTDDRAAFLAADADADGRDIVVPVGDFYLSESVTINAQIRFEGRVILPAAKRLVLRQNFDLPTYIDAFGGDEMEGFRRAVQALLNYNDHESLDMGGRRIEVTEPIDIQAAEGTLNTFEVRRVIRNGQFNVIDGPAWETATATSTGSYSASNPKKLTNVANVANIEIGSRVSGNGVGREVYVTDRNVGQQSLSLSQPLYGAAATQSYSFSRYRYVLDFSGFQKVSKFTLEDIELQCNGFASGILLAPDGETFHIRDSSINRPKDRGITSHGTGCQDLQIDRCHFNSNEQNVAIQDRTTVAFNVNANDAKIRENRFQRFLHTGLLFGSGHVVIGNHWFQGDGIVGSGRVGGLIFTYPNCKSVLVGNYIDNCYVEMTNEHDANPEFSSEFSFGGLTITGNSFTVSNAAPDSACIVVKPHGPGHFLHGLTVTGNVFKATGGNIARIEKVDTTIAGLDFGRTRNVVFDGNTFNGINAITANPAVLEFQQVSAAKTWVLDAGDYLPFGGYARTVPSVSSEGPITNGSGTEIHTMPYATPNYGPGNQVRLTWSEPVKGRVQLVVRADNPV
ncbi:glycosyl hydrolase family 28-related protein [Frigidibacter sp. ROC022]|uniref:glycosyl hydrolase family 28-related protein n=1 Tax=Frigidibacter sp. ROC022 TaxID=2971796 RepID=UPI003082C485